MVFVMGVYFVVPKLPPNKLHAKQRMPLESSMMRERCAGCIDVCEEVPRVVVIDAFA